MNDTTFVEAARHLAESVLRSEAHSSSARIDEIYLSILGRLPSAEERDILEDLHRSYADTFRADLDAAEAFLGVGDSPWDSSADPRELAAYTGVASLVLNLDEAVTKQ